MAEIATNLGTPQNGPNSSPQPNQGAPKAAPVTGTVPNAPGQTGTPSKGVPLEPAATEKVSPKLQMLISREKKAVEREKSAKTLEEQISAREESLKAREAKLTEFESLKQTNPLKALQLLNMSYEDLTMAQLNDGIPTPDLQVKTLEGKFTDLQKQIADKEKAEADQAQKAALAAEAKANEDFQREISGHLDQNSAKYELIRFERQEGLVFQVINAHYERTIDKETGVGKIMSIEEAADRVEAFLSKKYEDAFSLEKFKKRVVPPQVPPKLNMNPPGLKPMAKTLTNGMSANAGTPRARPLTDEERIQKAIAYARNLRTAG